MRFLCCDELKFIGIGL